MSVPCGICNQPASGGIGLCGQCLRDMRNADAMQTAMAEALKQSQNTISKTDITAILNDPKTVEVVADEIRDSRPNYYASADAAIRAIKKLAGV